MYLIEKYLLSTQNYLPEAFKLTSHINYLHPNIEDMTILYFYCSFSYTCY